ncbi:tetratricopeptide repeat-containing glycosyltransferase family protein [Niveispirillum lacus]|uniref:tetratricopeptide repeat-containing glycosyltransferase family protein n=1 Tax=Niveispirillum lacus TaxID=1981099 RepID=UPI001FE3C84C|nr:tetratricopeptide repeat-containing glycosyltransferase family protein [Niveispirillum lacus]
MTAKKRKAAASPKPPPVHRAAPAPVPVTGAPAMVPLPAAPLLTAAVPAPTNADEQALQATEETLRANPRDGGAWSTLGILLRRLGRIDEAMICHRRGLEFDPGNAGIWSNLGNLLTEAGRHDEAAEAHAQAMRLVPDNPQLLFNAVIGRRKAAAYREALFLLDKAVALGPVTPALCWERALTLLQVGEYELGFREYEARRHIAAYRTRPTPGAAWDGSPLNGKRIFLSTEQGFGDTLMAARYVELVKARGGRILFECHPELRRVLGGLPVDEFVPAGSDFPEFDVQASQMSLPYLCGTTFDTIPPPVRLHIPPEARAKAARVLGSAEPGILRVGIIWSGRVTFADNQRRATDLSRFLRFGEVPGVRLYSLQKGPPEEQLDALSSRLLVTPLGPHIDDFADTAAMLEKLDLLIMTDSSTAHLAGSLGTPVWNLVQYMPYWVYGDRTAGTPWYPSMRLFRQTSDQDWEPVFQAAVEGLRELARARRAAVKSCGA